MAPDQERKRLQLLAHSAALRTALRRALNHSNYALTPDAVGPSDVKRAFDEARPDCLVLDTELPGLRGLGLLQQIARADPRLPIVVVAPEAEMAQMRTEAVEKGAIGVISKPASDEPFALRPVATAVIDMLDAQFGFKTRQRHSHGAPSIVSAPKPTVTSIAGPRFDAPGTGRADTALRTAAAPPRVAGATAAPTRQPRVHRPPPQVLVVASSTGGPQALITLFSGVNPAVVTVPVLIVQHMPAAFTPILAEHITRATAWTALEAKSDEPLVPGEIRIAPGGHHMVVCNAGGAKRLKLTDTEPVNFCRPSADVLFVSAAEVFGRGVLGVILTGMGNDGCQGAKVINAAGGAIYAQDKETSVVWGMPGAAVGAGVADRVFPLPEIAPAVQAAMKGVY
ncbi:chemotaxis protein CheB [Acuticoccus sediminis]|nr:chemotaxis protein CheB [Acuticoccus sediminis]